MLVLPTFDEEKDLWSKGYDLVIGVDEVGRGCFAGPIVAAAVSFSVCHPESANGETKDLTEILRFAQNDTGIRIDDSKRLKPQERRRAAKWIAENCLAHGIGEVNVATINKVGIGRATEMAMRQAITSLYTTYNILNTKPFVLIDTFYVPYVKGIPKIRQKAIKKGDQKSISIAAASIVAKVYRDSLMQRLARKHVVYGWGRNKGYGTRDHQEAIIKNGITKLHRVAFVETFLAGIAMPQQSP